jgi:hypothetical protein
MYDFLFIRILVTIPRAAKIDINDEPPDDTKTRGTPVVGSRPRATPQLTKNRPIIQPKKPMQKRRANGSRVLMAVEAIANPIIKKRKVRMVTPKKPDSSAITAKIKSLFLVTAGKYPNLF